MITASNNHNIYREVCLMAAYKLDSGRNYIIHFSSIRLSFQLVALLFSARSKFLKSEKKNKKRCVHTRNISLIEVGILY